jgi:hypothetical protein
MSTEAENVAVFLHLIEEFSKQRQFEHADELYHPEQASLSLPLLQLGHPSCLENIRAMPAEVGGAGE